MQRIFVRHVVLLAANHTEFKNQKMQNSNGKGLVRDLPVERILSSSPLIPEGGTALKLVKVAVKLVLFQLELFAFWADVRGALALRWLGARHLRHLALDDCIETVRRVRHVEWLRAGELWMSHRLLMCYVHSSE